MEADKSKGAKWQHANWWNEKLASLVINMETIFCPTDIDPIVCLLPDILLYVLTLTCDSLKEAPRVAFFLEVHIISFIPINPSSGALVSELQNWVCWWIKRVKKQWGLPSLHMNYRPWKFYFWITTILACRKGAQWLLFFLFPEWVSDTLIMCALSSS